MNNMGPRIPDLAFTDAVQAPEKLHSFESQEVEAEYLEILAEDACDALEQVIAHKNSKGLAELLSKITEQAYALVEDGVTSEDAVTSIVVPLRRKVQQMMQLRDYTFTNNDVHDQIGHGFEVGLITDLSWLESRLSHPLSEGMTRQIYTNAVADDRYAIDFVEAIWTIDPADGSLTLERLDLVQNKTGAKLPPEKAAKILDKHKDFVRDNELVMMELRAIEATYDQVRELMKQLGAAAEVFLPDAFLQAYTGDSASAVSAFQASLDEFKTYIKNESSFTASSKPIKRAYIKQIEVSDAPLPTDELAAELAHALEVWKEQWADEVGTKKERVLSGIRPVLVRSVISFASGQEIVEALS